MLFRRTNIVCFLNAANDYEDLRINPKQLYRPPASLFSLTDEDAYVNRGALF